MNVLHTIDVAHPPRPPSAVEHDLAAAWDHARRTPGLRLLKIVHGYGSTGGSGTTRTLVRNWAWEHRRHFRAVIPGEEYTLFRETTRDLRTAVGQYHDPDLGQENPGILLLWIR